MAAVSEMPLHEQRMADEDPDLLRACNMTGSIRWLEIYRAYLLQESLDKASADRREEIVERWGKAMGVSPGALKGHLKWANAIFLEDLQNVFAEERISENEWTQRIGTSHLRVVARAKHQANHLLLSSRERAEWVRRAYHANFSVAELEEILRNSDLLPPKRGSGTKPTPAGTPATGCDLLFQLAVTLKESGHDFPLEITPDKWGKPYPAWQILRKMANRLEQLCPGAMYPGEKGEGKS